MCILSILYSLSLQHHLCQCHSSYHTFVLEMSAAILKLKSELDRPVDEQEDAQTGIMALKFMQRSLERKRQAAKDVR